MDTRVTASRFVSADSHWRVTPIVRDGIGLFRVETDGTAEPDAVPGVLVVAAREDERAQVARVLQVGCADNYVSTDAPRGWRW